MNSTATQCEIPVNDNALHANSKVVIERICSAQTSAKLPMVTIKFPQTTIIGLIDTGSSISLLDQSFFYMNKQSLNYKNISRQVSISTINSSVNFSSCINLSFKLEKKFFKHPFFVTKLNDKSFSAIIGYDFLTKFHVDISNSQASITFDDIAIPFIDSENQGVYSHVVVNAQNATLVSKTIIKPNSSSFVKISAPIINSNSDLFFEPVVKNQNLLVHPSIIANNISVGEQPGLINDNSSTPSTQQSSKVIKSFILIENLSNKPVHVNKNAVLGQVCSLDEQLSVSHARTTSVSESVNLITASPEILNLRKSEFNLKDFKLSHLNPGEISQMSQLLSNHATAFSSSSKSLGHTDRVIPNLNFDHDFPLKTLPFPIPQSLQAETKKQIDELVEAGIIERTLSDWACPVLLVKKKQLNSSAPQKFRLALDLRLINQIIKNSSYPLPKINDIISNIAQYRYFTTLDLKSAYHQIDLPEKFQDRLSFTSMWGQFKYKRLVFGLRSAASFFQALVDTLIEETNELGIFAYQDDIVICANSFQESCQKLKALLSVFSKNNITAYPPKCSFHQTEVDYLGFKVSQNTISPISSNIIKVTSFPTPKTKKQLKRFLGVCNYYRHLIPRFSNLVAPLISMTSMSVPFNWTDEASNAFQSLQKIFFSSPFIRQPNFENTFYVNTDASKEAISAVLLQDFDGQLLPVSYFSKSLNKAERNYPALKLELMAIAKGVQSFKQYLYNREFFVLSDSKPLMHYKKTTSPASITTRWLMSLSEYSFKFIHVSGTSNVLPDYFSRTPNVITQDLNTNANLINSKQILPVVTLDSEEPAQYDKVLDNNNSNVLYDNSDSIEVGNSPHKTSHVNARSNVNDNNTGIPTHVVKPSSCSNSHFSVPYNTQAKVINCTSALTHNNVYIKPNLPPFAASSHSSTTPQAVHALGAVSAPRCEAANQLEKVLCIITSECGDAENEISSSTILKELLRDEELSHVYNKLLNRAKDVPKNFLIHPESNLLLYSRKNGLKNEEYVVLPAALRPKALRLAHLSHFGLKNTYEALCKRYWWRGAYIDCANYVASCRECILHKKRRVAVAPVQSAPLPTAPGQLVSLDLVGPFRNGHSVLTIIDHFSRFLVLEDMPTTTADRVTKAIFRYVATFGRPSHILTDLGPQFTSVVFKRLLDMAGIRLAHSSPGHPEANGVSERINASIKSTISTLQAQGVPFDTAILIHASLYNSAIHSTTGHSPAVVHFGRALALLTDSERFFDDFPHLDKGSLINNIIAQTKAIWSLCFSNTSQSQANSHRKLNRARRNTSLKEGDIVYVKYKTHFTQFLKGPFAIVKFRSNVTVVIRPLEDQISPVSLIHVNRLIKAPTRKGHLIERQTNPSPTTNNIVCPSSSLQPVAQMAVPGSNSAYHALESSLASVPEDDQSMDATEVNYPDGEQVPPATDDEFQVPEASLTDEQSSVQHPSMLIETPQLQIESPPVQDPVGLTHASPPLPETTINSKMPEIPTAVKNPGPYNLRPRR